MKIAIQRYMLVYGNFHRKYSNVQKLKRYKLKTRLKCNTYNTHTHTD